MANPSTVSLQLEAGDADGIALAQAVGSATSLTLNGAFVSGGVATLDVARRVLITASGANPSVVFTVTGADRDGNVQTDTVTGLSASSGYTAKDFLTVTRVASSASAVGNISVGTNEVASTAWIQDFPTGVFWALSVAGIIVSGAATYNVEHTYDDPNKIGTSLVVSPQQYSQNPAGFVPATVWIKSDMNAKAASAEANYTFPVFAHRLTITSGTGLVALQSLQAGIGNP